MRYVVVGAGAVGGAIGTALLRAGCSVTLVARGGHLEALRADGLTVATPSGTTRHQVDVAGGPRDARLVSGDVLLLAVKSQDTASAIATWSEADVVGPGGVVAAAAGVLPLVCLQNGVTNERFAQRFFDRVVAACVWVPSQMVRPGVLVLPGTAGIGAVDVGCYPSGADDVSWRLASDLSRGGIVSRATADTMRLKYYKLLANIRNAVAALFPPDGESAGVAAAIEREARAVFAAAGVDLTGVDAERARVEPLTRVGAVHGVEYVGNSTAQSLASGTGSVETDYLNGEVVLLGRLHGVPTPVNRAVQRLASRAAQERAAPRSCAVSDLELERSAWN
jgi:2-dehydropantoate 2-reductase